MQSSSKTYISGETAAAIVREAFGSAARLRAAQELTGGYFSAAYRLDLDDGQTFVLKAAPPPSVRVLRYEQGIMHAEVEAMRLVRAQTGVPVPEIVAYDDSKKLLPVNYFVMDFVPGAPLNTVREALTPQAQAGIDRTLGGYLREINGISGAAFGLLNGQKSQTWRAAFAGMLRDVLDDGREIGAALPLPAGALYERLAVHFGTLDAVGTPRLVHWDLWDGNIFVDETGRITGIIDFERALWGDALMELNFRACAVSDSFATGYGVPACETADARTRRALYDTYLYLIMVIEDIFRAYTDHGITEWARGQLTESLAALGV